MNIEIKIPGFSSPMQQPTVHVTQPTIQPIEYTINMSDSPTSSESSRPINTQTNRFQQQTTYVTPPSPIISTSQTRNVVTSTSTRTRERDVSVNPQGLTQDATTYHGYYTTPVTVTSTKTPDPKKYLTGPTGNPQMSLVQYDNRSFQATMDLSQYHPQEVQVRVKDRTVTVTASHREANLQGGFTQRNYSRQYTLPDDVNPNLLKCFINEKGDLSVEAPRIQPLSAHDRVVPIELRTPQQQIEPTRNIPQASAPPAAPPTSPPTPEEPGPRRPPRPANYGGTYSANGSRQPQRTHTVSFTNNVDSGRQPEVVNERPTPIVEDVTSDVESQKIDFKTAKKMFNK